MFRSLSLIQFLFYCENWILEGLRLLGLDNVRNRRATLQTLNCTAGFGIDFTGMFNCFFLLSLYSSQLAIILYRTRLFCNI